ncbi:N-acetyltransferase [Ehrlichia minasensis]|uniref:N-acetyltransferase n=1 Tax=Ehrlichia minasensis TaxID=1242993 RepID=A0A4Q6I6G1_9RICK|nr:GNAT family N-acetyltransferase [Ehrlichia minasensis]RZB12890.1 N-acetyltransferase [Ehrlichia minasensis]CEI84888.1 GCN5-related N-acetyltransferase [Ehrlichia minasensis]
MENGHISSLVVSNLKDYMIHTMQVSNLEIHHFQNITLTINDSKSSLLNFAFYDNTTECNEKNIIEVLEFLKKRKIDATWPVESHMKKLKSTLEKLGLVSVSPPKKAIANIENYIIPPTKGPNITLDIVNNEEKLLELDKSASKIFYSQQNEITTFLRGLANHHDINNSKLKFFLVKCNNIKVGICGMYVQDKVVGLYSDGVFSEYRNQGIASQMVLERIKIAKKQYNCSYAVAQCMKPSVNLYKRLGFKMLGSLFLYTSLV